MKKRKSSAAKHSIVEGTFTAMEVKELDLSNAPCHLHDYVHGNPAVKHLFDYPLQERERFARRAKQLSGRSFARAELYRHLLQVHKQLPNHTAVIHNIHKLQNESSVAVVGGQQAGLLTGPLLTIYKAITILLTARQQEKELSVPVVPIFWIAGEDHDLDEIRYVYMQEDERWYKHSLDAPAKANAASETDLSQEALQAWLQKLFKQLPETEYTAALIHTIERMAAESRTYVDFFTHLMHWLFQEEGLVLLDSHHPELRKIEAPFFVEMLERIEDIQQMQQQGLAAFTEQGYRKPIETESENAHLFYQHDGERLRLDFEQGYFQLRGTEQRFSREELIGLAKQYPERFSNNVVTRPLMQEWLLPVLAFVAGPGELAYWGTLRPLFHSFDFTVPPLVPRLQVTIVPRMIERWVAENGYRYEPFLKGEDKRIKEEWLREHNDWPIEPVISQLKGAVESAHQPLQQLAAEMDANIASLSKKNLGLLLNQVEFIDKKMNQFVQQKHQASLAKFDEAAHWLYPLGRPQERVIHPIILLNLVGKDGMRRLMELNVETSDRHKLLFL